MVTAGTHMTPAQSQNVTDVWIFITSSFKQNEALFRPTEESWQRWPWIWLDLKSLANLSIPVLWGLDKSCWRRVHKVARWSKQVKSQLGQCPLGQIFTPTSSHETARQKRDKKKGITLAVHLEQYCGSLLVQPAQNLQTFSLHGKEQEHSWQQNTPPSSLRSL